MADIDKRNLARTALSHTRTEPSLEADRSAEAPVEPFCSAIAVCMPDQSKAMNSEQRWEVASRTASVRYTAVAANVLTADPVVVRAERLDFRDRHTLCIVEVYMPLLDSVLPGR